MDFSIVIATYNRPNKVTELIDKLLNLNEQTTKIIVVDASDEHSDILLGREKIIYLRSSHKNQPFQRYLGYLASDTEILIFLDDDLEVVDKEFVTKIREIFEDKTISGIAINFANKHEDSL